ncbi:hypothetical protein M432DRAFT_141819 [Thermoascus aurantiacus ATCC 26904]
MFIMSESLLVSDLRHAGREAKRDHDRKAKWAYGGRIALPQKYDGKVNLPLTRPIPESHLSKWTRIIKSHNQVNLEKQAHVAKTALRYDINEVLDYETSDSSVDEDPREPTAARNADDDPDDDPLFSYEISGQNILSAAIAKAEERYEREVTEKLVKEYEFVSRESEADSGYVADVDGFELVDHVQL